LITQIFRDCCLRTETNRLDATPASGQGEKHEISSFAMFNVKIMTF